MDVRVAVMPVVTCEYCGDECYKTKWALRRNKKSYCGMECFKDGAGRHGGGRKSRVYAGLLRCVYCGERKTLDAFRQWVDTRPQYIGKPRHRNTCIPCERTNARLDNAAKRRAACTTTRIASSATPSDIQSSLSPLLVQSLAIW